ncbi:MAG TPA: hypothetical protein VN026_14710 [Bacteroidia bacterium]|nr:hypothetical protein [Bacteroidia bacterium]
MKEKHIIIYTFQSLEDPLVKGLILEYLKGLKTNENNFRFHLITHEQKEFVLTPPDVAIKKNELLKNNIKWYPVKYRSGNLLLFKKMFNFLQTFFITLSIKRNYKPAAILGFLSISGGYSYILSKLLDLKLIVYCFEPHSKYMVDFNIWPKTGLKYKLLRRFEYLQLKHAVYTVVPNNFTKALAEEINKNNHIFVCPISIDTNLMIFDEAGREKIRNKINANGKTVIIYTGKFGGIYYSSDEIVSFFSGLYQQNSNLFLYIITPNETEVRQSINKYKLTEGTYYISMMVNYTELNQHISAADIGLIAVPSLPSQKYRTPVKTAIYLSCGVPYIVNKNIGDDDSIALHENIGLVIEDLNEDPSILSNRIIKFLGDGGSGLKTRCRNYAITHRGTNTATAILQKIFSGI